MSEEPSTEPNTGPAAESAAGDVATSSLGAPARHEAGGPGPTEAGTGVQRIVFWASMAVGAAIIVFAIQGIRGERLIDLPSSASGSFQLGTFLPLFVGGAILVDLLLIPISALIGLLVKRVVPLKAWPPVRAGLIATGILALYSYPLVFDRGGNPGNETLRTRDFHAGLLWLLVATWIIVGAYLAYTLVTDRRRSSPVVD